MPMPIVDPPSPAPMHGEFGKTFQSFWFSELQGNSKVLTK